MYTCLLLSNKHLYINSVMYVSAPLAHQLINYNSICSFYNDLFPLPGSSVFVTALLVSLLHSSLVSNLAFGLFIWSNHNRDSVLLLQVSEEMNLGLKHIDYHSSNKRVHIYCWIFRCRFNTNYCQFS